jgi:hypothetical protein
MISNFRKILKSEIHTHTRTYTYIHTNKGTKTKLKYKQNSNQIEKFTAKELANLNELIVGVINVYNYN